MIQLTQHNKLDYWQLEIPVEIPKNQQNTNILKFDTWKSWFSTTNTKADNANPGIPGRYKNHQPIKINNK